MPILDFIIIVFCLIDDEYKKLPKPIRQRGFKPALADSEVITMEIVEEFLGIDTDKRNLALFQNLLSAFIPSS